MEEAMPMMKIEMNQLKWRSTVSSFLLVTSLPLIIYMDLKPPAREEKIKEIKAKAVVDKSPNKRDDTKRSSEKKNNFSKLIYQKGYIVLQVAEELEISRRTAYDW